MTGLFLGAFNMSAHLRINHCHHRDVVGKSCPQCSGGDTVTPKGHLCPARSLLEDSRLGVMTQKSQGGHTHRRPGEELLVQREGLKELMRTKTPSRV